MKRSEPLKVGIVAGEESGDLLAADLVRALERASGRPVRLVGVGGDHLRELGLQSLFDPDEIGLMGVAAILRDAPRLMMRIGQTAKAITAARPDCLLTVDVPEFSLRVARRARKLVPRLPVIHYVCPSVWAWRPGRAADMKAFVDHVLCILPFEPAELERLGGPPGSYVGHRLTHEPGVLAAKARQAVRSPLNSESAERTLLLLPGSRRGEVSRLLADFRSAVAVLASRGFSGRLLMPTVQRVRPIVEAEIDGWSIKPELLSGQEAKWHAFAQADAALIASGTVSLELALCAVPHVSTYRLDPLGRILKRMVMSWTGSLPNLIADDVIVPEHFDHEIRPPALARQLEALMNDTEFRRWQLGGFEAVAAAMRTSEPAGAAAARIVLELTEYRKAGAPPQRLAIGT